MVPEQPHQRHVYDEHDTTNQAGNTDRQHGTLERVHQARNSHCRVNNDETPHHPMDCHLLPQKMEMGTTPHSTRRRPMVQTGYNLEPTDLRAPTRLPKARATMQTLERRHRTLLRRCHLERVQRPPLLATSRGHLHQDQYFLKGKEFFKFEEC